VLDRNSVLTLMEECFWDEIETFTIECVSELGTDELEIIFTDYLVDYASLDEIEELKITDMEIDCEWRNATRYSGGRICTLGWQ